MNEQEQLAEGIYLAAKYHKTQFDKGDKPYVLHPLYLMNQLLFDTQLATIAVLHDVVEDSNGKITVGILRTLGFSERVCEAIEKLTHNTIDDYLTVYIPDLCTNYDCIRVKRKDIDHNSRATRLKGISPKDEARIKKYHEAFLMLGAAKKKFQLQFQNK